MPAHPRSRGEHGAPHPAGLDAVGSSPLARGTHHSPPINPAATRLIPARAGNTAYTRMHALIHPAHPRSRGEHEEWLRGGKVYFGSSPLARGTHTPQPRNKPPSAHPRSRGEHLVVCLLKCFVSGSSPLARGTLSIYAGHGACWRLIPARAGNTFQRFAHHCLTPAHPRSRGEHALIATDVPAGRGSSPLARGTRDRAVVLQVLLRLIPARAGNTGTDSSAAAREAAHPRSRGEHISQSSVARIGAGSSPLARGTHGTFPPSSFPPRLIPARAGNTPARR